MVTKSNLGLLFVIVFVSVIIGISNSSFIDSANILNLSRQIAMVGIFSIGVSFVIISGGIDLSVGSMIGLTGVLIAKTTIPEPIGYNWPLWLGIIFAIFIVMLCGLIQGLIISKFGVQPFIVTLGGMLLLRGVSQTICEGGSLSLGKSHLRDLTDSGVQFGVIYVQYPLIIFLFIITLCSILLHFTVYGRYIYAIGGNKEAAYFSGVPIKRVEVSVYVMSAAFAGVSGVLYCSYAGRMSHNLGIAYELIGIAASVLGGCSLRGGTGTIIGVVLGSCMMKVIDNGINLFKINLIDSSGREYIWRLDTNWREIIFGVIILLAVLIDNYFQQSRERKN
jgi:ribose transport system permease protein